MSFPDSSQSRTGSAISSSAATHPSLHIRDAHDAHVILEAVRQNILPIIKRRLLSCEREELASGHVYVWEEAQDEGGLLRWTDGRRWSQSRMRGDYLFYEEKVETTQEERDAKAARRARRVSDPTAILPIPTRRKDRPSKPGGLTKQTYSVAVHLPGSRESRRWHVVAYFSGNDYARLPVIENYDYLRNIKVPPGVFLNSKILSVRMDHLAQYSDESEIFDDVSHSGVLPLYDPSASPKSPLSSTSSSSSSRLTISPPQHHRSLPSSLSPEWSQRVSLPPLVELGHSARRPSLPHPYSGGLSPNRDTPTNYTPLSIEDRRVLDRFRVVL